MHRLVVALTAVLVTLDCSAEAARPPVDISEPRNAAAGFAVTTALFQMDTLGRHCADLEGMTAARAQVALGKWQQRNGALVDAAMTYVVLAGEYMATLGAKKRSDGSIRPAKASSRMA